MKVCEGMRFGQLTVIEKAASVGRSRRWLCLCDCGNAKVVYSSNLANGDTTSCGCYRREHSSEINTKHREGKTRLYRIWSGMKRRCLEKTNPKYPLYGGRGIKVCNEWKDYIAFREWALANGYGETLTIDRIDVNGNYCPENCRWATQKEQQNNRTTNRKITYCGETHTVAEWSEITGLGYTKIYKRIRRGWEPEQVLTTA